MEKITDILAHLRQISFWNQDNNPKSSMAVEMHLEEVTKLLHEGNKILSIKIAKLVEENRILKNNPIATPW